MAAGIDHFSNRVLSWHVAAVMSEENARALQWALNDRALFPETIQVTCVPMSELKRVKDEYDAFLVLLDLGQPVPVNHLASLENKVGLCAIVQPTPVQLLHVARLPHWRGVQWEPGDHVQLAKDLAETLALLKGQVQKTILLESVENWVSKKMKVPARLSLVDPPKDLPGTDSVALVLGKGTVTVGAADSTAGIRLPLRGKHLFFELMNLQDRWVWRKITHGGEQNVSGPDVQKPLETGDSFQVGSFVLTLKPSRSVEELLGILHQAGLRSDSGLKHIPSEPTNMLELLKEFMLSALSGELRLSGPTRKASIFLEGGRIQQVLCGSVYGLKGLLRVFSWKDFRWSFNLHAHAEINLPSMDLSYLETKNLYGQWASRWSRIQDLMPTANVRLGVRPDTFLSRSEWTTQEYTVVASVCEFKNISEILNNCPLWDLEIMETLVSLRQQRILAVI